MRGSIRGMKDAQQRAEQQSFSANEVKSRSGSPRLRCLYLLLRLVDPLPGLALNLHLRRQDEQASEVPLRPDRLPEHLALSVRLPDSQHSYQEACWPEMKVCCTWCSSQVMIPNYFPRTLSDLNRPYTSYWSCFQFRCRLHPGQV